MSKIKTEVVTRNPNDLKPDPEQPRKKFDQEKIAQLSQTMKTQGVINPIEIDENNVSITGEMRWRASKKANLKEIECRQLIGLGEIEKFERQTIENLHHSLLTSIEKENAIKKLWESKKYKSKEELADILGMSYRTIHKILRAYGIRKEINSPSEISTKTLDEIAPLLKEDKKKVIDKIIKKEIKKDDVLKLVKTIRKIEKKAPEVKAKILDDENEITDKKLKEVEEIAELPQDIRKEVLKPKPKITIEEAKEVAKMPNDVKREVLKPESEITVKEAKEIAEFPKTEQRKAIIKQMKQTKQAGKKIIEQKKEILQGKRPVPVKKIDLDMKFINAWKNTKLMDIPIKIKKKFLESYSEDTKQECYALIKSVVNYLIKEFSDEVKVIE